MTNALLEAGFVHSNHDYSLFTLRRHEWIVIILVYVDDLLITGSNEELITEAKGVLHRKFKLKDLGELKYFLGIEVLRSKAGIILNQKKYILELISNMGLSRSRTAITPLEPNLRLTTVEYDYATGATWDELLQDVGKLMYVTVTRPDLCYIVQTLSQFMQKPKKSHWESAIRVIRYLKNTPGQGDWLRADSTQELTCWYDSDWAACPNTKRSVTGYVIKFGESLISWKKNNKLYQEVPLKLSTGAWPQLWQKLHGFLVCSENWVWTSGDPWQS